MLSRDLAAYPTVLGAGKAPIEEGEMSDPYVPVEYLPFVRPVRPVADFAAVRATRSLIDRERPQLVHTHMAKAGAIGRIAASTSASRPIRVHTFHGHVLEGYFPSMIERGFVRIERMLAKRTDALIAVSDEIRDQLLDLGIGEPSQWHVVPLGFDLEPFLSLASPSMELRNRLGLTVHVPLVGVIGRLAPVKDHELLIRALARLEGVHLAILGDGEQRARLTAQVESAGLQHRIHFVGWWKDVASAISDLDVVALSSINEGTPVSLIESLAAATPVVA